MCEKTRRSSECREKTYPLNQRNIFVIESSHGVVDFEMVCVCSLFSIWMVQTFLRECVYVNDIRIWSFLHTAFQFLALACSSILLDNIICCSLCQCMQKITMWMFKKPLVSLSLFNILSPSFLISTINCPYLGFALPRALTRNGSFMGWAARLLTA